jgi:hypothetical protein
MRLLDHSLIMLDLLFLILNNGGCLFSFVMNLDAGGLTQKRWLLKWLGLIYKAELLHIGALGT